MEDLRHYQLGHIEWICTKLGEIEQELNLKCTLHIRTKHKVQKEHFAFSNDPIKKKNLV